MIIKLIEWTGFTYVFDYNGIEIKVRGPKSPKEAAYKVRSMFESTHTKFLKIDIEGWE